VKESKRRRCAGYVARMGIYKYIQEFGGKPEGKKPLERTRHQWKNVEVDLRII
jgi:hypothetical protein